MSAESPKYGRLTVLRELEPRRNACGKSKRMVWAVCKCGSERSYQLSNLKTGNTTSCGCHRRENLDRLNTARAAPQEWVIAGEVAYIVLNDIKVLIDAVDVPLVSGIRWYMDERGYVDGAGGDHAMHRLILGLKRGDKRQADHKSHVNWDNRRSNIRIATNTQNQYNRRSRGGSSKYKGVCFDNERGMYVAQIGHNGVRYFLGRFSSEERAARVYDREAAKRFGKFAYLNFGGQHVG